MGFEGSAGSRRAKRIASSAACVSPSRISLTIFKNAKLEAAMMKTVATTSNSSFCQSCRHFVGMFMPSSLARPLSQVTVFNAA